MLRPAVICGGDAAVAAATATLAAAVDGGAAFLGGGRAPALADVAVFCTLLPLQGQVREGGAAAAVAGGVGRRTLAAATLSPRPPLFSPRCPPP